MATAEGGGYMREGLDPALVIGLGVTGQAVARALHQRGVRVTVVEDEPSERTRARGESLPAGVAVEENVAESRLEQLVAETAVVVPSPGVPLRHPVYGLSRTHGRPVLSEPELAWRWTDVPIVAVTGTNGKTTVTTLATAMLIESGVRAQAAGNIGAPLIEAIEGDADVLVVEVSSFQLAFTQQFRPRVAVLLNIADDHHDWHGDHAAYVSAKTKVWANQAEDDLAVANADDRVVAAAVASAPARVTTFGLGQADWHVDDGRLLTPAGDELLAVDDLGWRPHELANALAAAATATAVGASLDGCRAALLAYEGLPHRVALVGEAGGVRWYDDSKATNPHAALAAIAGFPSVVLIAGGRNKGLDLSGLGRDSNHVRAVVAIGEAASEIEAAFAGRCPVKVAFSMDEAVDAAADFARPGDVVLLSPACASFDWYASYAERGDDFARAVRQRVDVERRELDD